MLHIVSPTIPNPKALSYPPLHPAPTFTLTYTHTPFSSYTHSHTYNTHTHIHHMHSLTHSPHDSLTYIPCIHSHTHPELTQGIPTHPMHSLIHTDTMHSHTPCTLHALCTPHTFTQIHIARIHTQREWGLLLSPPFPFPGSWSLSAPFLPGSPERDCFRGVNPPSPPHQLASPPSPSHLSLPL